MENQTQTPETAAVNINELSAAELEALLKQKRADEEKEQNAKQKKYEEDKERFLKNIADLFVEKREELQRLKDYAIENAEHFNAQKYILDGKPVREAKSFELKNDDIKVVVEIQERFGFNDKAEVHISAIRDIFKKKFEARSKSVYALLDSILMRNTKGDYDAKLLTKATNQVKKIGDESLTREFDKLRDCLVVTGSAKYVRLYVRDSRGRWDDVSLQFSAL